MANMCSLVANYERRNYGVLFIYLQAIVLTLNIRLPQFLSKGLNQTPASVALGPDRHCLLKPVCPNT